MKAVAIAVLFVNVMQMLCKCRSASEGHQWTFEINNFLYQERMDRSRRDQYTFASQLSLMPMSVDFRQENYLSKVIG